MHSISISLFYAFSLFYTPEDTASIDNYHLNEIYQKACHNCYQLEYAKSIYDVLDNVNAIEIDFYDSKNILNKKGAIPYHWYVRHEGKNKVGNRNCCYSSITGKNDLDTCLKDVAVWCAKHPDHDLISIFLDKKQSWSDQHSPEDLDNLILKYFDRNSIYKPSNLKGNFSSVRDGATSGNWPLYKQMKGKVLFALTGGNLLHGNKTLSKYVRERKDDAVIFIAPITKKKSEIDEFPKGLKKEDQPFLAFYNFDIKQSNLTCKTKDKKLISRVFNVQEDKEDYSLQTSCTNYIAVFNFSNIIFGSGKFIKDANR